MTGMLCQMVCSGQTVDDYYIFDTHLHNLVHGVNPELTEYVGSDLAVLEGGGSMLSQAAHNINTELMRDNFMFLSGGGETLIKRAIFNGGNLVRRSGWSASTCENHYLSDYLVRDPAPDDMKLFSIDHADMKYHLFPSLIGFSPSRAGSFSTMFLDDLFDMGYRWIGEKLGDPCWKHHLSGNDLEGSAICTNHPSSIMTMIMQKCGARDVPVATHMPQVGAETWTAFVSHEPYECPGPSNDCNECLQYLNILEMTDRMGVDILHCMGSANLIVDEPYLASVATAFDYLFDKHESLHLELIMAHMIYHEGHQEWKAYTPGSNYNRDYLLDTYFDQGAWRTETSYPLQVICDHADRFTICSHSDPWYNFSPRDSHGPIGDDEMWEEEFQQNYPLRDVWSNLHVAFAVGKYNAGSQTPVYKRDPDGTWAPFNWNNGVVDLNGIIGINHKKYTAEYDLYVVGSENIQMQNKGRIFKYNSQSQVWTDLWTIEPAIADSTLNDVWGPNHEGKFFAVGNEDTLVTFDAGNVNVEHFGDGKDLNAVIGYNDSHPDNPSHQYFIVGDEGFTYFLHSMLPGVWIRIDAPHDVNINDVYGTPKRPGNSGWEWVYAVGDYKTGEQNPSVFYWDKDLVNWRLYTDDAAFKPEANVDMFGVHGGDRYKYERYIVGADNTVLERKHAPTESKTDMDIDEENAEFEIMDVNTVDTVKFSAVHGVNSYRIFAVGNQFTTQGRQFIFEGERSREWFNAYWMTFFDILIQYANEHDTVYSGDEIIKRITHCNVEELIGEKPLEGTGEYYNCSYSQGNPFLFPKTTITDSASYSNGESLVWPDQSIVIASDVVLECNGDLELTITGDLTVEPGATITTSGIDGASGGSLTINVGGLLTVHGEITTSSAASLDSGGNSPSGGILSITAEKIYVGSDGSIRADGLAPGSPGGAVTLTADNVYNAGYITVDCEGESMTDRVATAGDLTINVGQWNLINTGLISAVGLLGDNGRGGWIQLNADAGSIYNEGHLDVSTYGLFEDNGDNPKAGDIVLVCIQGEVNNNGVIEAENKLGDNGEGGVIDILALDGDINNAGTVSVDSYGLESGIGSPKAGDIYIITSQTLEQTGDIKSEAVDTGDPDQAGVIELIYEEYSE